jgi:hypothetical protein
VAFQIRPPLPEPARSAVGRALAEAGLTMDGAPDGYARQWWRTGVREAVDAGSSAAPYARSPRRTRGATRA